MATILFVCTGNICRSPIAEAFLRHLLAARRIDGISIESAGVAGWEDSAAAPEAIEALRELAIDLSPHQARRLSRSLIERADLVLAMAAEHRDATIRLAPSAAPRTFTLKELVDLLRQADGVSATRDTQGEPAARLKALVGEADRLRASGVERSIDEDVADPLGTGVESFRATAWEIEALCQQLVDLLFGPSRGEHRPQRAEVERGGRTR